MSLPKISTPVYELDLPVSKKHIKFRPFLVKEQKNLLMAMEAEDADTINNNIKQVLVNCTLSENVNIDDLPIVDIEYYFLHLRARSVGEVVDARYRCNNEVDGQECGNIMESKVNILDVKVDIDETIKDTIDLGGNVAIKLFYPRFSTIKTVANIDDVTDIAIGMIIDSIECIYDGQQTYYAKDYTKEDLTDFIESLSQQQFVKIEEFFEKLPKIDKTLKMKCSKCGYEHEIYFEGLESFFA